MNAGPRPSRALNLSLKHLRALKEVAELASFTGAAARLGMTQPGVSRLVGQVERDLGLALFIRSTRAVALTTAGRDFIPAVGRLLEELDAHVGSARATGGYRRGRIVVACLLSLTHHIVSDALLAYRTRHPDVEVQVREGLGTEVYEDVRSGIADFGIGNAVGLSEDVVAEDVIAESCVGVLGAGHPLAARRELTLGDFAGEPLVSLPLASGLRRLIDDTAATHGIRLTHTTIVEQFPSLYRLVAAELGIGIVPPTAVPAEIHEQLTIRPIAAPAIIRRIGILRLRTRGLTPAAQDFLEIVRPIFSGTSDTPGPGGDAGRAKSRVSPRPALPVARRAGRS